MTTVKTPLLRSMASDIDRNDPILTTDARLLPILKVMDEFRGNSNVWFYNAGYGSSTTQFTSSLLLDFQKQMRDRVPMGIIIDRLKEEFHSAGLNESVHEFRELHLPERIKIRSKLNKLFIPEEYKEEALRIFGNEELRAAEAWEGTLYSKWQEVAPKNWLVENAGKEFKYRYFVIWCDSSRGYRSYRLLRFNKHKAALGEWSVRMVISDNIRPVVEWE